MRPLPDRAFFNRADARALGWTDSTLSRAAASGTIVRLRRNWYARAEHRFDPVVQAHAAVRGCRGAVVSHRSAALLHGLPLLESAPSRVDITLTPRATGDTSRALLHRATLRPHDIVVIDETPVTSVARTITDLARSTSTRSAVVTLDAALHWGMVASEDLADVADMCRSWPGGRRIASVIALGDARAESPLESCSRLVLRSTDLPTPALQPIITDERGRFLGRVDFYWDGVVGEADGRSKYDHRDVLVEEKLRQERLEDAGLVVLRWGWSDLRDVATLTDRIRRAMARASRTPFPRQWSVLAA